ncbi:MAG: hypothetical protein K9K66_09945 [Desulfarculaceae bacterium]|nr:hypothetical protein [Desulfarculaceae bacterium]MCF8073730.1 hypothetical protein [Desulfarculaceae bacterium]MCF8101971.1 hypothetical protein [Desulfarculaceae bacterium]MCF8115941.1 hypothetical protein [Desulfarculaceae bacterium]
MSDNRRQELEQKLASAREELAQAQAAMPAHSVRPWQFERLEAAEEAVASAQAELEQLDQS